MSKRQYGTGTIDIPPGSRTYRARWRFAGVRYAENTGTEDRAEALRYLADRLAECRLGLRGPHVSRKRTVADLLDGLIEDYRLHERASLPQIASRVRTHLKPILGRIRAVDFGTGHIETYKRQRKRQGASLTAIDRELANLRLALRMAVDAGYLTRAPKVKLFQADHVRTGYLEDAQYRVLRDALPGYLQALFVVAYHTGARLGEMRKLTWDRVDFAAGQIFMEPRTTKARKPRTLPIYGEMREYLTAALRRREAEFPACRWVFTRMGDPIIDFRKAWSTACALADCADLHFHDLRRTASRNMCRAGIPDLVIRRIIGHETDSMFKRYGIVDERDVRAAGERAAAFLEGHQDAEKPARPN